MRLIALVGATKIGVVVYTQLLNPTPPSLAEIEASERQIAAFAREGEERVFADFRKRSSGVLEAAGKCATRGDAPCRWAEIWLERYRGRALEVLATPARFPTATVEAAARYREADRALEQARQHWPGA